MSAIQQVLASINQASDPASIIVSGAGTADANGTYTRTGTNGGKSYYNKSGTDAFTNAITWSGGFQWVIFGPLGFDDLYAATQNVASPDLVTITWSVGGFGTGPSPTVVAG